MSSDKLLWVNKYELPCITIHELDTTTRIFEEVILKLCIDSGLHLCYHTTTLVYEILHRRSEYFRYITENKEPLFKRLTYPTSFLGAWLKYMTATKYIADGVCDGRCVQLFELSVNDGGGGGGNDGDFIGAADVQVRRLSDDVDSTKTYPMGPLFLNCGPARAPPGRVRCSTTNRWTDICEVKYAYYATEYLQQSFADRHQNNDDDDDYGHRNHCGLLFALLRLFRVRYKTGIGYTLGVGNDLLDVARETLYDTYESYIAATTTTTQFANERKSICLHRKRW